MSGGLDSSVTAWLLAREGRPVVGLSMLLWDHSGVEAHGRCCGALDLGDAKRVAQQAGIPHYTLRMDRGVPREGGRSLRRRLPRRPHAQPVRALQHLDQVRPPAGAGAAAGRRAGWRPATTRASSTGPDGPELHTAVDAGKDQSYYLFELTAGAARRLPLPARRDDQAARCASSPARPGWWWPRRGRAWRSASSPAACASSSRRRWPSTRSATREPALAEPARAGRRPRARSSATGQPYYRYTVGQRRGLGPRRAEPALRAADRARGATGSSWARTPTCWPPGSSASGSTGSVPDPAGEVEATVKIRSRHPGVAARIRPLGDGRVEIDFADAPARRHPRPGRRLLPGHPRARRLLDRGPAVGTLPEADLCREELLFLFLVWAGLAFLTACGDDAPRRADPSRLPRRDGRGGRGPPAGGRWPHRRLLSGEARAERGAGGPVPAARAGERHPRDPLLEARRGPELSPLPHPELSARSRRTGARLRGRPPAGALLDGPGRGLAPGRGRGPAGDPGDHRRAGHGPLPLHGPRRREPPRAARPGADGDPPAGGSPRAAPISRPGWGSSPSTTGRARGPSSASGARSSIRRIARGQLAAISGWRR